MPLRDVGARVEALLARTLDERRVRLRIDLPAGSAWADPDKLLQALLNLVENAAVHGPPDAEVRCVAEADPERAGWWRVEVLDLGRDVPEPEMESWFAPHARGDEATARGTGLGLYVVRSIAERWGGAAWGRRWADGNAFGFSVPRERSAAARPVDRRVQGGAEGRRVEVAVREAAADLRPRRPLVGVARRTPGECGVPGHPPAVGGPEPTWRRAARERVAAPQPLDQEAPVGRASRPRPRGAPRSRPARSDRRRRGSAAPTRRPR